jgi:PIN domain nuclease of toxin-antitoxin system
MLAMLQRERGEEILTADILGRSIASTINVAEVQSKLVKMRNDPEMAWVAALSSVSSVEPYTREHARIAGDLITMTEKYGLSLGDRSCLALAIALNAPVYTTEQLWRELKLGVPIHVIR